MKLFLIWNFSMLLCSASSNLYSSTVGLERILKTEDSIIEIYQSFVLKSEQLISELKRKIDKLKKEHEESKLHASDPFNSFHLIKRILIDWSNVEKVLSNSSLQEAIQNITELKKSINFPTDQDLKGTADAINLISDTYDIEITNLANGIVNGIQYPSQLSAYDCYELGLHSFEKNDFNHAYSWMDEALKRFLKEEYPRDANTIEKALEIKAYSAYQLGYLARALKITTELLKLYPDNPNAPGNIKYYSYMLNRREVPKPMEIRKNMSHWDNTYSELCRKTISLSVEISSQLKCQYVHNGVPFLRLAPIKEEEVVLNPRIVLFKDALYDLEIELLKKLAKPKLETALVVNFDKFRSDIFSKDRIGQMSWIKIEEHPRLRTIIQRAEDMTKLDPSTSEDLQVVNYGIGGHYKPHFDSLEGYDMPIMENGDRIATLLYYMNDVDQGGATVFNKLNVVVLPEKGTALLWYNQLPNGNKDERSLHGACPVVAGTKWICTIWFRSKGQELRRPCLLKQ